MGCSYLAMSEDIILNWQNDELEWWSMKVSALKIFNESNHTKIAFNQKKCSCLSFTDNVQLDQQNNELEWCSMKLSAFKICYRSSHTKLSFNQKYKWS